MPLPEDKTAWPPQGLEQVYADMQRWDAWISANPDDIAEAMAGGSDIIKTASSAGGVVGRVAKMFWSRPNTQSTKRYHVPVPKDVATGSSDLLFAEPPTFALPETDPETGERKTGKALDDRKAAQARIDEVLNNEMVPTALIEAGELSSRHGGVFLKLWWDGETDDRVRIAKVPATQAIPVFRYDRLVSVTFVRVVDSGRGGSGILRHLECHEPGSITHGLYRGHTTSLGRQVSLDSHPSTEWLANMGDKNGAIKTGTDRLTAVYVANPGDSMAWQHLPGAENFGRSDFEGIEDLFDSLDETYSSLMRDIRIAKGRIFVSEDMLQDVGPGKGGTFDEDQEVFTKLNTGLGSAIDGAGEITTSQFQIRHSEHSQTLAEILNTILRSVGLSASHFSDSMLTVGVRTATEVEDEAGRSERTRNKKLLYYRAALAELAETAMVIDTDVFDTGIKLEDPIGVSFPVQSTTAPSKMTGYLVQQRNNSLISMRSAVRKLNPNMTVAELDEEIELIRQDMLDNMNISYGKGFGVPGVGGSDIEELEAQGAEGAVMEGAGADGGAGDSDTPSGDTAANAGTTDSKGSKADGATLGDDVDAIVADLLGGK